MCNIFVIFKYRLSFFSLHHLQIYDLLLLRFLCVSVTTAGGVCFVLVFVDDDGVVLYSPTYILALEIRGMGGGRVMPKIEGRFQRRIEGGSAAKPICI